MQLGILYGKLPNSCGGFIQEQSLNVMSSVVLSRSRVLNISWGFVWCPAVMNPEDLLFSVYVLFALCSLTFLGETLSKCPFLNIYLFLSSLPPATKATQTQSSAGVEMELSLQNQSSAGVERELSL